MAIHNTEIIFFDIDGTLSRDGSIHPHNLTVLHQLKERGVLLVIATGRGIAMMPHDIEQLFQQGIFDAYICMNGQYNCTQETTISHYPLSRADADTISDICSEFSITYKQDSATSIAWSQHTRYYDLLKEKYPAFVIDANHHHHQAVYQCSLLLSDEHETTYGDALDKAFSQHGLQLTRWQKKGADVLPRSGSKARGIRDVCEHFGIDVKNSMAFGDGQNDIEMLQYVGCGVAMQDGNPELLSIANYTTPPLEEKGIEQALRTFNVL